MQVEPLEARERDRCRVQGRRRGAALAVRAALACVPSIVGSCASPETGDLRAPVDPGAEPPAWVREHPRDPRFPRERYLTGIGSATVDRDRHGARALAEERAKAEIARILRTEIESVVTTWSQSRAVDGEFFDSEEILERIRSSTHADLRGAEVVDTWLDEPTDVLWVKVALSREKHARKLMAEVEADVVAAFDRGVGERTAAELLAARLASGARLTAALARLAELRVVVERGSPLGLDADRLEADVRARARDALGGVLAVSERLELAVEGGADQLVGPDGSLPEEVVVRALLDGAPFAGFPLAFRFPGASGRALQASDTTDPDGRVRARIDGLRPTADAAHAFEARLDFERFAPGFPAERVPAVRIPFELPDLAGVRFAVEVRVERSGPERGEPRSVAGGRLRRALEELLTDGGAALVAPGADADFALQGRAEVAAQPRQRLFVSLASASLVLTDRATGEVVAAIDVPPGPDTRGFDGQTQERADADALAKLTERARAELHRRLAARFALPDLP